MEAWLRGAVQTMGVTAPQSENQLRNVREICGTLYAFAAILADGSVVTWGNPRQGGNSSRVQDHFVYV